MYFSKSYYDKFLIIVVLIVTFRALLTNQDGILKKREGRPWRLPNTTVPFHYDLHLTTWVYQNTTRFTGNVTIKIMVMEFTKELVLHMKNLDIHGIKMQDMNTMELIKGWRVDYYDDLMVLSYPSTEDFFYIGQHVRLEIFYAGFGKDNEFGFKPIFKNHYIIGAFTRLEPIYARTVLPCYDEPALKAKFSVKITHDKKTMASSNMPAISTREDDVFDTITTTFEETPKMSTYLLAILISDFPIISEEHEGVTHRLLNNPNGDERGNFVIFYSRTTMYHFASYVNREYALPQIDHVAVDSYNTVGWGLITYPKSTFFGEVPIFSQLNRQNHELIHQWFGSLVTPTWWDSIWLSEGLATYYSYKLTDTFSPVYNATMQFQYDNCKSPIWEPVIEYVETPDEIKKKFGNSIYKKAPCLLYMLETIIGEKTLQAGVQDYLRSYAYSNANSDQFFERIDSAVDKSREPYLKINVFAVMKPYFTRSTRPKLTIFRNFSDSNTILIKQKSIGEFGDSAELWCIPLGFAKIYEIVPRYIPRIKYILSTPQLTINLRRSFNLTFSKSEPIVVSVPGIEKYIIPYRGK